MREVIFESVHAENFKSHEVVDFEFEPNRLVCITGNNGTGKTSMVVDTLLWGLFDEASNGLKGDDVIRIRSGKDTYVRIRFRINDDRYTIKNYRKHSSFGDAKIIKLNGEDISRPTRAETNKMIENILLSKSVFENSLLFSQFISKPFMEMTPGEHQALFDKMLGFIDHDEKQKMFSEKLKSAIHQRENMDQPLEMFHDNITSYKENLSSIQGRKDVDLEIYKEKKVDIISDIINIEDLIKNHVDGTEKISMISRTKDSLNTQIGTLRQKETQIENSLSEKKKVIKESFRNKYENDKLQIENEIQNDVNKLEREIDSLQSEITSIEEKAVSKKSQIENETSSKLNDSRKQCEQEIKPLELLMTDENNKCILANSNIGTINKDITESDQNIENIQGKIVDVENPICFTCGQDIIDDSLDKVQHIFDLEINNNEELKIRLVDETEIFNLAKEEYSKIESELKQIKDNYYEVDRDLEDNKQQSLTNLERSKQERVGLSQKLIDDNNSELLSINNNINQKLQERIDYYKGLICEQQDKIQQENIEAIDKVKGELTEVMSKFVYADDKIKTLQIKQAKFDIAKNTIDSKKDGLKEINDYMSKIESDFEQDKKIWEDKIEEDTTKVQEIVRTSDTIDKTIEILTFWKKGFGKEGIRSILMDDCIPILNERARQLSIAAQNIKVSFNAQTSTKTGNLKNKFSIAVVQTKNLTDKPKGLSAGESRMVCIIVLMSLRHLLETVHDCRFNILLFDEVFDALDPDNIEIVLKMINDLSQDHCVVLISHTLRNYIEADEHLQL